MPITIVGYSSLKTNQRPLHLHNILHVLRILKNLLFVHKLTYENNIIFEFHPHFCLIKDWTRGEVLLCGTVKDGLYRLNSSQRRPCAMVGECTSSQVWHQWLRHPHFHILQNIITKFRLLVFHRTQLVYVILAACPKRINNHSIAFLVQLLEPSNLFTPIYRAMPPLSLTFVFATM